MSRNTCWCATTGNRGVRAHAVQQRGVGNGWIVDRTIKDLEDFGHAGSSIRTKCDQEPAILEVQRIIAQKRKVHTSLPTSPFGDSQSNGAAENAIRSFRGMYRTHNWNPSSARS